MQGSLPRLKMGRQKIAIKFIEKRSIRMQTFRKRAEGLYKKAIELHVLCNAVVELKVFFSDSNKEFFYSSHPDSPINLPSGVTVTDVVNSAKRPAVHRRKAPRANATTGCTGFSPGNLSGSTGSTNALVQYVGNEKENSLFGCQGGGGEFKHEMEDDGLLAYKVDSDDDEDDDDNDEQGDDHLEMIMNEEDVNALGFEYNDSSSHVLYSFHAPGGGGGNSECLYELEEGGKIEDGFMHPDHPILLHEGDFSTFLNDKPCL